MTTTSSTETGQLGRTIPGAEWFTGAGLGIFVHWDHASQRGLEISWPLVGRAIVPGDRVHEPEVSVAEYQATAATFDPQAWDAGELARLAKEAGATYVVLTARHHAGYSLFHTAHSDFSIEHSRFGRDIVKEFVAALHDKGLRVGIYYSLSDWNHLDYPAFTDEDRPYPDEHWPTDGSPREGERFFPRSSPEAWERYRQYLRGQLTELLTNYGRIDLLFFDGEWERSAEEWDSIGLRALIKELQPDVVINERLSGNAGDYATPEQGFPATTPPGPWELNLTMGEQWAYNEADTNDKSARTLIVMLGEVTSRGGNLLLNVGPRGDGSLSPAQVDRLHEVGEWMLRHGESVLHAVPAEDVDFYGPVTRRGETIYLHLAMLPVEQILVRGIPVRRVRRVRVLQTGEELAFEVNLDVHQSAAMDTLGELRIPAFAPTGALVDVVAVELDG